jgi:hypothetical protein
MRRALIRTIRDFVDTGRRQVRRFFKSPALAFRHLQFQRAMKRCDWPALRAMLRPLAGAARSARDHRMLSELGYAALRLEEPQLGAQLLHASRDLAGKIAPTDWRNTDIRDATLIVQVMETANQGVAMGMAYAGRIAAAAEQAARTVIVVESRMVPLFSRTLPNATVLPFGADLAPFKAGKFVTATTNDVDVALDYDGAAIVKSFRPLIADPSRSRALREKYRGSRAVPLIGLSWSSTHFGKDLPALAQWARLVRDVPAQFISLQYGDVSTDLALLNEGATRVIVDPDIDQMRDMDAFAAQIDALDLVVTISNSAAHLTGALGKPFILVRDDLFRRNWSYLSRAVPWYPSAVVIGKDGRRWEDAFEEIIAAAKRMIQAPKP